MRALPLLFCSALTAALTACGGSQDPARNAGDSDEGPVGAVTAADEPTVRMAAEPADPCDWIPVSEVEAVIGKLAEPPKRADGCRYTMVLPEAVSAQRRDMIAQQERLNEALKAQFKDWEPPEYGGSMSQYQHDPKTYALTLKVDVKGNMAGEVGMEAAGKVMESWLPELQGESQASTPEPAKPAGWDALHPAPYGFAGRVGHINISVQGEAPDVPSELAEALATRVRDRLPDLPFPATNPYQIIDIEEKHPCSLLTREEAEAVLGPLVVEPYRSSSEWPPLAHAKGHACAYFTAGHHVFVVAPTWTGGEESFAIEKGIGGLVGAVLPKDKVVIKGPWDKAQIGMTGELQFLKGDRLLTIHYATSSTDRRGAVKLAAQAMPRMQE